jgi:predicted phage-related endonuclease
MPHLNPTTEAEWLALREDNIGGSEVAGLFAVWLLPDGSTRTLHAYEDVPEGATPLGSCSPYTNGYKLYCNKAGLVMPEDFNPSERMMAGTYFEPAMAEWAKAKWGMKLRKVRRYSVHPEVKGWGASVDYEVFESGMPPVEFKNIDFIVARDKWVIEDGEVIAAPLHIQLQAQHYVGARGSDGAWIIACVGGNELVRGWFPRHEPTIERLREAITAFWQGVATCLPPVEVADFETVAEQFAIGVKEPNIGAVAKLEDDTEATLLARRYMRLKDHETFMKAIIDRTKAKLALKVGDATKAFGDGWSLSWPSITREAKTIPAREQTEMTYRGGFTVREVKEKSAKAPKATKAKVTENA